MSDASLSLFIQRRSTLLDALPPASLALIPAAHLVLRSRDTEYPFRQQSDFWYLTGCNEPEAVLVLIKPATGAGWSHLFCLPRHAEQERWTGYRLGPEGALATLGVEQASALTELDEQMIRQLLVIEQVWLPFDQPEHHQRILDWRAQAVQRGGRRHSVRCEQLRDLRPLLAAWRQIKSPEEIALLRQAADISAQGHLAAMRACRPGIYEYQLQAVIEYHFKMQGASGPAYGTIVGSGAHACILHYVDNQACLRSGDLVLIDAGAEYQGYAGDITRTFPVNGQFNPEQLALYRLVLQANELAISLTRPGETLDNIHQAVIRCLTTGLIELGLLTGDLDTALAEETYRAFYMHGTSHWLGLDVHDVGAYRHGDQPLILQPHMVFTIEPGLYIAPDCESAAPQWRGIGIRIEDDVVVTETGCEVLTAQVPKQPHAIEALMQAAGLNEEI